jgi:hypothetical protein
VLIDQLEVGSILFDPCWDASQYVLSVLCVVANGSAGNHRPLMIAIMADFGDRYIEFAVEPGYE